MIHYHGVRISGKTEDQMSMQGKHVMVTFAKPAEVSLFAEICQSFTVDNGAFSCWKSGHQFDIQGFADFIKKWHLHPGFDFYLMPDVIDGDQHDNHKIRAEWSQLCQGRMWGLGVPVWHLHEPVSVLAGMVNAFPRVALGSSGEYSVVGDQKWWNRMSEAMEVACDSEGYPKSKLHGLRMLNPTVFSHLPLSSADSTNVARNAGIDSAWKGPYAPVSRRLRALVLAERIESHASAARWAGEVFGIQPNLGLFG